MMKRILYVFIALLIAANLANAQEEKKEAPKEEKSKSTEEYIADLSSKDEDTICTAANWLGKEEEEAAMPKLIDLLQNDKRSKVRVYSVIALGLIKEKGALEALEGAALNDQNADVRYSAVLAIVRIGSDEKRTLDVLEKVKNTDSDPYIKDFLDKLWEKYKK
jgi:HEAT repeat protein